MLYHDHHLGAVNTSLESKFSYGNERVTDGRGTKQNVNIVHYK